MYDDYIYLYIRHTLFYIRGVANSTRNYIFIWWIKIFKITLPVEILVGFLFYLTFSLYFSNIVIMVNGVLRVFGFGSFILLLVEILILKICT